MASKSEDQAKSAKKPYSSGKLCCAIGCKNYQGQPGIQFFRALREDKAQSDAWAKAINRADESGNLWRPKYYDRICSDHFISGKPSKERGSLDYRPTKFADNHIKVSESAQKRYARVRKFHQRKGTLVSSLVNPM